MSDFDSAYNTAVGAWSYIAQEQGERYLD